MKRLALLFFPTLLSIGIAAFSEPKFRQVCYYYKPEELPATKIDVTLCTDIIYYGIKYENSTLTFQNKKLDESSVSLLKKAQKTSHFRLLAGHGFSGVDPEIGGSPEKIARFAAQAVTFLRKYRLDGLDLDWEYPGTSQRQNFSQILRALRKAFDGVVPQLSLSIAAAAIKKLITESYDIPVLGQTLDFMSIMSYSYRAWEYGYFLTGHHAPLFASRFDYFYLGTLNLNWTAFYFLNHGVPKKKIVLGIPTYSIGWNLRFKRWHTVYAPANGPAKPEELMMPEICRFLRMPNTKYMWDTHAKEPYASNGGNWYSFDDFKSATIKANYIKKNEFGGAMLFSLNADADFNHSCGVNTHFPMHSLVASLLNPKHSFLGISQPVVPSLF